ncbi:MAG: ABC transporter ATP-binding protein [Flavobacteriales bacterium]|jgi:ATP-binding cassette, subfamily B, bacterial PglK|nr:ABC transporter ATP-binding protein [Flavobacteriales bacterium]
MKLIIKVTALLTSADLKQTIILFFGMLLQGLTEVAGVASLAPFMAVVSNPDLMHQNQYLSSAYHYFGYTNDANFLVGLGVGTCIVLLFVNGYSAFVSWRITRFGQLQGHNISMRLLKSYLSQSYLFFLNRNTSDMGKNILSEVLRCVNGVILPTMYITSKLIISIFIIGFLFAINPFLAIISFVLIGGSYWIIFGLIKKRLNKIGVASTNVVRERFKIAHEAMSGIKDIKLYGSEGEFLHRFSTPSKANARYTIQSAVISTLPRYLMEMITFGGIISLIAFLIIKGGNIGNIIPIISVYVLASYRLLPALQQIYVGITRIKYNLPALNILIEDISLSKEGISSQQKNPQPISFNLDLQFQSLKFSYPNKESYVIDGLNLDIKSKTTVGLVGKTGSGKTTFIDIILGLLPITSGKIIVDGVEITQGNLSAWQKKLGYVPQSIYLTDDTIERNIAFAIQDDNIDTNRIIKVAQMAELDDFIQTLPGGYQTYVGERGVRLSGGQRQRIGIARALYRNPAVLVLDEATSSLDGITESVIMDTIHNLSHKKTIILIAHRLTTVKECDMIHIMDKGSISDSGTYDELMLRNVQFQKMSY